MKNASVLYDRERLLSGALSFRLCDCGDETMTEEKENADDAPIMEWRADKKKVWRIYRWGALVLMLCRWAAFGGDAQDLLAFFAVGSFVFFALTMPYVVRPHRLALRGDGLEVDGVGTAPLAACAVDVVPYHSVLRAHALVLDMKRMEIDRKTKPRGAKDIYKDTGQDCMLAVFFAPRFFCNQSAGAFFEKLESALPERDGDFETRATETVKAYAARVTA